MLEILFMFIWAVGWTSLAFGALVLTLVLGCAAFEVADRIVRWMGLE